MLQPFPAGCMLTLLPLLLLLVVVAAPGATHPMLQTAILMSCSIEMLCLALQVSFTAAGSGVLPNAA
jgi:hypothetical protein